MVDERLGEQQVCVQVLGRVLDPTLDGRRGGLLIEWPVERQRDLDTGLIHSEPEIWCPATNLEGASLYGPDQVEYAAILQPDLIVEESA